MSTRSAILDWIRLLFWQPETSGEVAEVNKQLKFKSHQRMQVEFISNNVDVMTHDCLSSVALAFGVIIDQHLNWKDHISMVSHKISKSCGIISRIRNTLDVKSKKNDLL